jgi:hypothetical protein
LRFINDYNRRGLDCGGRALWLDGVELGKSPSQYVGTIKITVVRVSVDEDRIFSLALPLNKNSGVTSKQFVLGLHIIAFFEGGDLTGVDRLRIKPHICHDQATAVVDAFTRTF